MINNFKRGEYVEKTYYELRFYRDASGGFAFPCDKEGNLIIDHNTNPVAIENYHWCMEHPDNFPYYFNHVSKRRCSWREPNTGNCHCGQEMELIDEYMGAYECPKCGQWYNVFGQELKNPDSWRDADDWDDDPDAELW